MLFGLVNIPATFQAIMNNIFPEMLDQEMSTCMDNIIMWSDTRSGHDDVTSEVVKYL